MPSNQVRKLMQTTYRLAILIWPDADSRHHAAVLMFENITMVYKITGDGEWDVHGDRISGASTFPPVVNARAGAIGVGEGYAIH